LRGVLLGAEAWATGVAAGVDEGAIGAQPDYV